MGCYVGLIKDGKEVPGLGMDKWAGSREFAALEPKLIRPGEYVEDDPDYRPADFASWRQQVSAFKWNVELFTRMLDALEEDPDIWIDVSY